MTIKARFIALPLALVVASTLYANAAGTINLSLSQQFDAQGKPLSGCKLYFYETGTTTPQNAYADTDLTIALPNPLECDASGRLSQFFLADGSIKIRLTDKNGVQVLAADNLLVIGPSSGGGGGGGVDATTIYQTGDIKIRYSTGAHTGWVRANARTIGSATSGATERANSDTQALWEHLCSVDTTLRATISGGYSGNCANDFAANKTIQLPDFRGRVIAGLDDMGASAAGRITATYCATGTTLGNTCGAESTTFAQENLPNVNFTITGTYPNHSHQIALSTYAVAAGIDYQVSGLFGAGTFDATQTDGGGAISGTAASGGSGTPFSRMQPTVLMTTYIKL